MNDLTDDEWIRNGAELKVAERNLQIVQEALQALNDQLATPNPELLETASAAYRNRIKSLQDDIAAYQATDSAGQGLEKAKR